jgi:hypothetical protein
MIRSVRKAPVRWSFDNIFTIHLDGELANSEFYHKLQGSDGRLKLCGVYRGISKFKTYLIEVYS